MNRRSLLDYIDDKDRTEETAAPEMAARLEQRLADLEQRLSATRASAQVVVEPAPTLSSQIESILYRQPSQQPVKRPEPSSVPLVLTPLAAMAPAPRSPRDLAPAQDERSEEFAKFVEAVYLIGQAAKRFLREPPKATGPSEDIQHLAATLKETVAAFQTMTADLAGAAAEIRRTAETPQPQPHPKPLHLARREDTELLRLQDDLDALRERLATLARHRT